MMLFVGHRVDVFVGDVVVHATPQKNRWLWIWSLVFGEQKMEVAPFDNMILVAIARSYAMLQVIINIYIYTLNYIISNNII